MSRATPEATGRRHRATTCSISPQWPPGRQSTKQQSNNTPTLLAVLMAIAMQWYGTIPHTSPDRGGSGLQQKPLVAAIRQVSLPIVAMGTKKHRLFSFFIVTCYKRDQGDVKDPNNNRGMTYRSNGKELDNTIQYFVGGVNITE
jgi:hypothetical protein